MVNSALTRKQEKNISAGSSRKMRGIKESLSRQRSKLFRKYSRCALDNDGRSSAK